MSIDFEAAAERLKKMAAQFELISRTMDDVDLKGISEAQRRFLDDAMAINMILMERQTLLTANGLLAKSADRAAVAHLTARLSESATYGKSEVVVGAEELATVLNYLRPA